MSSRGGFDAYRQSVLGGRASPCGARLTFSSGQASGSQSLSLSQSLTLRISPLSFRFLTLSLGPFLSLRHTPLPNNIDFSKSGFGSSLSLSVYLSHTHKTTPPLEIDGEKNKESSKLFLYQKQRPAIAAKCKED